MIYVAMAKNQTGADQEAVAWSSRAIEANRNYSTAYFWLAAALAVVGRLDDAHAVAMAGLSLDPTFTIARYRAGAFSDNPVYLRQRERLFDAMRKAGVPEE